MQGAANANEFRSAGIDVSKATLHVHVLPGNAKFQVPNDKTGVVRLCRELAACGAVVMEATGRHHRLAQQALLAAGLCVAATSKAWCARWTAASPRSTAWSTPWSSAWKPSSSARGA